VTHSPLPMAIRQRQRSPVMTTVAPPALIELPVTATEKWLKRQNF